MGMEVKMDLTKTHNALPHIGRRILRRAVSPQTRRNGSLDYRLSP
jgi:hypothetical protein